MRSHRRLRLWISKLISPRKARTAGAWMAKLRGERATQDDRDAYGEWLDACPENRASAGLLSQIWQALSALRDDPMVRSVLRRHRGESRHSQDEESSRNER